MGQFYMFRLQALDANSNPIPGARLYTFDSVATTTPKATYSDNALSTSNGPYVEAGADGVFPQIFGASGTAYFASLRTPAGVEVAQYQFITTLGAEDATILERDFGANGRFQVRGYGGIAQIEVGDPLGDDVGGTGRIGGWDGTQGDALEIDYAETTVTGDLTVSGSFSVSGTTDFPQLLTNGSVPAATSFVVPLDAAFDRYDVIIEGLATAALPATIGMVFSFDGGVTYKTASGSYKGATNEIDGGSLASSTNDTSIRLQNSIPIYAASYRITIFSKTGQNVIVGGGGTATALATFSTKATFPAGVSQTGAGVKATHVKFASDVAFTAGLYAVYGLPGV